jgi:tRNA threonylcarbamoyl adenosine modification protein YeaZ
MRILALDTSSPRISVAVADKTQVLARVDEIGSASTQLLPCIERVLKEANLELKQIDAFAIGEGPGSYNGLRCGFATLQGILLIHPRPVVQINSLLAMLPASQNGGKFAGVVLNARKQMFYFEKFKQPDAATPFEQDMATAVDQIPGIDAKDGVWYGYEIEGWPVTYPDAAVLARRASRPLETSETEKKLGEPRYLRPPV